MTAVGTLHSHLVFQRRTRVLADALAQALPSGAMTVLDVGCGDGSIAYLVQQQRPGMAITGVDVLIRPDTRIPVKQFDGVHLPFENKSFDIVMFVDVLHHTDDPGVLLREAKRVAAHAIVLKDHTRNTAIAGSILRFMDWVGNAHHGVALPYNYWSIEQWRDSFEAIGLVPQSWRDRLGLYPFPASLVFEHGLHFVTRLMV